MLVPVEPIYIGTQQNLHCCTCFTAAQDQAGGLLVQLGATAHLCEGTECVLDPVTQKQKANQQQH